MAALMWGGGKSQGMLIVAHFGETNCVSEDFHIIYRQ